MKAKKQKGSTRQLRCEPRLDTQTHTHTHLANGVTPKRMEVVEMDAVLLEALARSNVEVAGNLAQA